jgi:hypothetical protein
LNYFNLWKFKRIQAGRTTLFLLLQGKEHTVKFILLAANSQTDL